MYRALPGADLTITSVQDVSDRIKRREGPRDSMYTAWLRMHACVDDATIPSSTTSVQEEDAPRPAKRAARAK